MAFARVSTAHEDEPYLCSKLLGAIIKFWSLILLDQQWTLKFDPGKIPSEPLASPLSSLDGEIHAGTDEYDPAEDHFSEFFASKAESPGAPEDLADTETPADRDLNRSQTTLGRDRRQSVFATLSLRGELDRLLCWSAEFTDQDLNQLTQAGRRNEIGSAVLECLLYIAETLCSEYTRAASDGATVVDSMEDTLSELARLAQDRKASIKSEDEAMYDPLDCDDAQSDGARSFVSDSTLQDGREERLFTPLRLYIDRLQGLSKSMRSVLADLASNTAP